MANKFMNYILFITSSQTIPQLVRNGLQLSYSVENMYILNKEYTEHPDDQC
jgi:hypothetical protein